MWQCKFPKIVYDPYQVLPSFGESDIEVSYKNNTILLKVIYEDEDTEKDKNLIILFKSPVFYKVESFPGVKGMNIEYEDGKSISSLVEFLDSQYKVEWEKHFDGLFSFSHYKIFFLNINKSVEVICQGFQVLQ